MDKRSLCLLIICLNVCLVIWLVSVQQVTLLEPEVMVDFAGMSSTHHPPMSANRGGLAAAAAAAAAAVAAGGARAEAAAVAGSAGGYVRNRGGRSNPNQIPYQPSRTFSLNDSLVSNTFERPATPWPTTPRTAASLGQSTTHLMDMPNFEYQISQPACDKDVKALVLIHSAIDNAEKRRLIRSTWANRTYINQTPLRVIFLLGAVSSNYAPTWQKYLGWENKYYGDILQGNFVDAYRNMTYKHVMGLKWFTENCPNAQLLVKVDDDVFVNTPQLVKYMEDPSFPEHQLLAQPDLLLCRIVKESRVKRSYRSKWRVTYKEYPHRFYPHYCPGMAIIYASDVVHRLYKAAQKAKYFWVDDVLVTGILAEETGTKITSMSHYLESKDVWQLLEGSTDLDDPPFLFTNHAVTPEEIFGIWQMVMDHERSLKQSKSLKAPASSIASASASSSNSNTIAPAVIDANFSEAQTSSGHS
ncbi:beta-1,3-galactosyltransferase 1 [Drosophila serrata]|uniref:beta-1,3-galactosyltransferase 1 n=1 Tax=Drosophila serrata TaxID=7274 RepID=UPI000A1D0826|nr:beta-1,3-galactosyltransferase 1 [Drosophila serrata]XP_020816287.1 beta-1,3-galactosyltransferase 1 [Drosophila serrata]